MLKLVDDLILTIDMFGWSRLDLGLFLLFICWSNASLIKGDDQMNGINFRGFLETRLLQILLFLSNF